MSETPHQMSIDKTLRVKLSGTLRITVEQKLTRKPSLEVAMTNIATILEDHESRLAVHLLIMSNSRLLFRGWPQFRGGGIQGLYKNFQLPFPYLFQRRFTMLACLWHRITRSSAIAEVPRDASCQLKFRQLPCNSAETTYTTSPDQIDGMKLDI